MNVFPMETEARRRAFVYWAVGGGLVLSYAVMRGAKWQGGAPLHTLMEGLAFLLALAVGAMALVRFYAKKNNTFLFIGTGFLGTALLDGYHAVVTSAFFAPYLPSDLGSLIPWSWVASRLFLSALLCLSWLAWKREQRLGAEGRIGENTVYLAAGVLTVLSFLFFVFVPQPRAYYDEIIFHRPEEFVPAALFLVALVGYLRKGAWRNDAFEHWLVLSLIVGFLSQAVYMSFSDRLFDLEFDAAHLLKNVSYVLVLIGLLLSMYTMVRQSEEREAHIRATSKILVATIENFPAGLSVFDSDLELVAFNKTFVDLLELPQAIIETGLGYERIIRFNAERGEYGEGDVSRLVKERVHQARRFEAHCFERIRPSGTIIEVRGVPMPEGGFLTTYTDITERKRNAAEIEKRDALLQGIVTTVVDSIIVTDSRGRITLFNPAAEGQFGYRASDVIGKNVSLLMMGENQENHDTYIQSYLKTGHKKIIGIGRDVEGKRADGSTFPMHLAISEMAITGERKFTAVIRDITELKERESTLKNMVVDAQEAQARIEAQAGELVKQAKSLAAARDAAMSAAAAKSEFLANMSHELRTPLNGMLGFADLIERESLGPIGNESYAEFISIIGQSGRHLLTVINDILDYSKIEAGKLKLDSVAFDLSQVVDAIVQLLASAAHDKAIELAFFVGPDVPMSLIGDPGRIRQVLLNLAGNAIKFTEEGGVKIEVSLESESGSGVILGFKITDTGIGIGAEEQKTLFDKFSQGDVSTTRKYGGTGLGLAICKQLVGLMSGEIGVSSRPDEGSVFRFTVALTKQKIAGKGTLIKIRNILRGRRALVVGGNPINRDVCHQYLEMLGAEVTVVTGAEAALTALAEAATQIPFDIAIVDHAMPDMGGEELGRRIRADARYDSLKLALSSSSGLVLSHKQARELGFDAALPRPLHRNAVLKSLGYLLGVDLPPAVSAVLQAATPALRRRILHILVAEDNMVNQLLLDTMLRGAGHTVDLANNGREAVKAVGEHAYDLVLMDMHMPELNGLEATRRIRLMPGKAAEVPIIAVTAAVMGEDREKCLQAGMSDFISKPICQNLLFERIAFWTHTEARYQAGNTEDNSQDSDGGAGLGEDAAAALDDLLADIDGLAGQK